MADELDLFAGNPPGRQKKPFSPQSDELDLFGGKPPLAQPLAQRAQQQTGFSTGLGKLPGRQIPLIGAIEQMPSRVGLNIARGLSKIPGGEKVFSPRVIERRQKELDAQRKAGFAKHPIQQFIGETIPEAPFYFAEAPLKFLTKIPGMKTGVGRFAKGVLEKSLPITALSAAQAAPGEKVKAGVTTGSIMGVLSALEQLIGARGITGKLARTGLGAAGGAGVGSLFGHPYSGAIIGGGAALGRLPPITQRGRQKRLLEGVAETPEFLEREQATQRLGLEGVQPSLLSRSPVTSAREAEFGRTPAGGQALMQAEDKAVESQKKSINRLFDTIYKKDKLEPEAERLFKQAGDAVIDNDAIQAWRLDPVISASEKTVLRKPEYKKELESIPDNTLAYWKAIKENLDDKVGVAKRQGQNNRARILKKTQDNLVGYLDDISPEYKQARSIYELGKTREALEKTFDTRDITGANFYKALANDTKYGELLHHLREVPEAQQMLKDMKLIFKDLSNPQGIKAARALTKTSMSKARSGPQSAIDIFKSILGEDSDKKMVDFMTNPEWRDEMRRIATTKSLPQRIKEFLKVASRVSASGAASDVGKYVTEND